MDRVVLAMSGGVDSSVAAHLLVEQGHDVIGVFMRHGEQSPVACAAGSADAPAGSEDVPVRPIHAADTRRAARPAPPSLPIVSPRLDHKQGCCTAADAEDARRVADRLGIPFYALNLQDEFGEIIDYFIAEYTAARTPNPCVMCNNWIKFGKLFDYADGVGARYVATGHYARLVAAENGDSATGHPPALLRGRDPGKDQSYVLAGIRRELLARMLLPVGGFQKAEIRRRAAALGLRVADKRDSQEICFVTSGEHGPFIRARRGRADTSGEIVTTDGRVVGRHAGIEDFTIGQRKGLGIALGEPHFVVRIEADTRRVVIGRREELGRGELTADRVNWIVDPPAAEFRCAAQIRYNSAAAAAQVEVLPADRIRVRFDQPRHGVAPGQAVVLYDGERVLAGGWIE